MHSLPLGSNDISSRSGHGVYYCSAASHKWSAAPSLTRKPESYHPQPPDCCGQSKFKKFSGWCRTSTSKPQETKKKVPVSTYHHFLRNSIENTSKTLKKNILRTSQNYEKLRNSHVDSGNSYEFFSRRFWVFPRWIWEFPRWVRVANFSGFETLISPGCRNYQILTSTPRILTSNPSFLTSSLGSQLKLQKMHFQELSTTISNPYSRGISTGNANFHLFGTCRWILPRT